MYNGGGGWLVYWWGCDSRNIALCERKYEALAIARALNETGVAVRWYARAKTASGLPGRERQEVRRDP